MGFSDKILDLLLGGLISKWKKKRGIKEEFEAICRQVLNTRIVNHLPVVLHELRILFIKHDLNKREDFNQFYIHWLSDYTVEQGTEVVLPSMTKKRLETLFKELKQLKL